MFKPGRLSQNNLYWKQNLVRAGATLFGLMIAVSAVHENFLFYLCFVQIYTSSCGHAVKQELTVLGTGCVDVLWYVSRWYWPCTFIIGHVYKHVYLFSEFVYVVQSAMT